ncbi:homeodomain-interacting protein kinase [Tanacetum coccineum]
MKLVWSPEIAAKAFMDTVKSVSTECELFEGSSVAELISAMAAGWNAKLIVETWSRGGVTTTSIGLSVASTHTCGRHVCIVPDQDSKTEYTAAMQKAGMKPEVIIGEPEESVKGMMIDFLVVDSRRNNYSRIIKEAKFGQRGAVLVCKNAMSDLRLRNLFDGGSRRIVRSVFLPVGKGLDIAHVAAGENGSGSDNKVKKSRWIRRVDRKTGEEFVIRK